MVEHISCDCVVVKLQEMEFEFQYITTISTYIKWAVVKSAHVGKCLAMFFACSQLSWSVYAWLVVQVAVQDWGGTLRICVPRVLDFREGKVHSSGSEAAEAKCHGRVEGQVPTRSSHNGSISSPEHC